jgi:hypothetical protein
MCAYMCHYPPIFMHSTGHFPVILHAERFCTLRNKRLAQPLTEMSTRGINIIMFLGSKVRRVRKADNLTAIYEPIV